MNANQSLTCNAQHPTPVLEIHGTADETVPYDGNALMEAIPNVIAYWVDFNNCTATPQITDVPNVNGLDGCTAVHSVYSGGDNGVDVEHYQIVNGGHTWPGSIFTIGITNNDFSASEKIWQFFMQYDINGRIQANAVNDLIVEQISVYPNPTTDKLAVHGLPTITANVWQLQEVGDFEASRTVRFDRNFIGIFFCVGWRHNEILKSKLKNLSPNHNTTFTQSILYCMIEQN
jgi:hypothetical protein